MYNQIRKCPLFLLCVSQKQPIPGGICVASTVLCCLALYGNDDVIVHCVGVTSQRGQQNVKGK